MIMKEIKLSQGFIAYVDDEDYEYLNQFKWHVIKKGNTYYARRYGGRFNGKDVKVFMHREIMKPASDMEVDHIDRNGWNNLKINLRICTHRQNIMNKCAVGRSKYKGVWFNSSTVKGKKYEYIRALLRINGIRYHIGNFQTEIEAARAYDQKAREICGDFANLNFQE